MNETLSELWQETLVRMRQRRLYARTATGGKLVKPADVPLAGLLELASSASGALAVNRDGFRLHQRQLDILQENAKRSYRVSTAKTPSKSRKEYTGACLNATSRGYRLTTKGLNRHRRLCPWCSLSGHQAVCF